MPNGCPPHGSNNWRRRAPERPPVRACPPACFLYYAPSHRRRRQYYPVFILPWCSPASIQRNWTSISLLILLPRRCLAVEGTQLIAREASISARFLGKRRSIRHVFRTRIAIAEKMIWPRYMIHFESLCMSDFFSLHKLTTFLKSSKNEVRFCSKLVHQSFRWTLEINLDHCDQAKQCGKSKIFQVIVLYFI